MINKKAASQTMWIVVSFVIVAAILAISFYFIGKGAKTGQQVFELSPQKDELCVTKTNQVKLTGEIRDIDGDGRADNICDVCVCATGCHNTNNDNDGDKLPIACDENDDSKKEASFPNSKCPEANLIELGDVWGMQCRPQ